MMSDKLQTLEKLVSLTEKIIYPPQQEEKTSEIKKYDAAVKMIEKLAEVTLKLEDNEKKVSELTKAVIALNEKIKRLYWYTTIVGITLAIALIASLIFL